MKLNINQIKSLASNTKTFERGVDYFDSHKVKDFKLDKINTTIQLSGIVEGSHEQKYDVSISIFENGNVSSKCHCDAFLTYNGGCKHIIAVLLEYYYYKDEEQILKSPLVKKTDRDAIHLINNYMNRSLNDVILDSFHKKVKLFPMLEYDYHHKLSLSFSVGQEKTYVIKDIQKFYYDMMENRMVEYGKNLTFLHHIHSFDESSQKLLTFFLNIYREYIFYNANNYNQTLAKRALVLSPSAIDHLFSLNEDKRISMKIRGNERIISIKNQNPPLSLSILQNEDDTFEISTSINEATLISGNHFTYILFQDTIYRLDETFYHKVGPLLKTAIDKKDTSMVINKQDMSKFCVNVLEEVKDHIKLEVDESILSEFTPSPLTIKLYIDMPENNHVVGELKFVYDELVISSLDDRNQHDIYRNVKEELIAKNKMHRYFETIDREHMTYIIESPVMVYELYSEGIDDLSKSMEIYATDKFKKIFKNPPKIQIGVKVSHNLLDLTFDTGDFPLDEMYDILSSYRQNKKYHRLKDGTFVNLENNSLTELSQITEGLDLSKEDLESKEVFVPKYRALYLDQVLKASENIQFDRDLLFKQIIHDIKDVENTQFEVPEALNSILRNYQKVGFSWLKTIHHYGFGGILADDMGLGKTLQIISLIESYVEQGDALPSLVVCPASLVLNWEMEIQHFAANIKVLTIIGNYEQRQELIEKINGYDVVVTSYDYLKRDIEAFNDYEFMFHVIDEAQYIKNSTTLNAKSVKQIKSRSRFALTGTPIENSLSEIWSIFDFIMPGYLYTYKKFTSNYEVPIVKDMDQNALNRLKKLVTPFILRRLKKDVLKELPDKTETTMYVNLDGEQKKLYLANLALIKKDINDKINQNGFNSNKMIILAMLTRLRQICCDPRLVYENFEDESAKLEMCLEIVEQSIESGHKILLFSQFTSMLAIIREHFSKRNISHYVLEGKTPKEERKRLVDNFNHDQTSVFLISLKAGGTGLNLTSADVVIHYDPWWNISAQNQATDRTHRIGQKEHVQVYKLISKDTIEEKILKLQITKMNLADSLIVEDDGMITKMTQEEILELFE